MLYILHGTDNIKTREKVHSLVDSLLTKKSDASFFRVDVESFEASQFEELLFGQGLFAQKYIVVFDHLFSDKETKELVLKKIKEIGKSENIFIFLEDELNKTTLQKIGKYAKKIQAIPQNRPESRRGTNLFDSAQGRSFDIFSLTDAFGKREKKQLWTLLQKAKYNSVSDEEILSILFWQTKSMLLAHYSKTAQEAGLNPFVFRKSFQFQKNYSKSELQNLSKTLVSLYHDARRGVGDLGVGLECFILAL